MRALVGDLKQLRLPKLANVGGVVKSLESVSEALSFAQAGGPEAIGEAAQSLAGLGGNIGMLAQAASAGWQVGTYLNGKINDLTKSLTGEDSLGAWIYDKLHPEDGAVPVLPVKSKQSEKGANGKDAAKDRGGAKEDGDGKPKPLPASVQPALQGESHWKDSSHSDQQSAAIPCLVATPASEGKLDAIWKSIDKLCDTLGDLKHLKEDLEELSRRQVVLAVDGRELGRTLTNLLGQEFQKPAISGRHVDARHKLLPVGSRR